MAGALKVEIDNVLDGETITTSPSPPYFQVEVSWENPKDVNGTVTLTATKGVTVDPAAGHPAAAVSNGVWPFDIMAPDSVSGVTLTARIDVPTNPPSSTSDSRTDVTVKVV